MWSRQDPSQPVEALEVSGKRHWSECSHEHGVFARITAGLAAEGADPKAIMIDATYLKAHRTACSLRAKKGGALARSVERKAA